MHLGDDWLLFLLLRLSLIFFVSPLRCYYANLWLICDYPVVLINELAEDFANFKDMLS